MSNSSVLQKQVLKMTKRGTNDVESRLRLRPLSNVRDYGKKKRRNVFKNLQNKQQLRSYRIWSKR